MSDWQFHDNSLGDDPEIDLPRMPIAHDPEFGVQRMLDGHIHPGEGGQRPELSNIHKG